MAEKTLELIIHVSIAILMVIMTYCLIKYLHSTSLSLDVDIASTNSDRFKKSRTSPMW